MQNLSPIGWAVRPLKNYARFSGRASRAEFWWFTLFVIVIYLVTVFGLMRALVRSEAATGQTSPGIFGAFGVGAAFIGVFWLAILIPSVAVQTRRLHDTNRSGWWLGAFYLLYLFYIVIGSRSVFSASVPSNGSPPNMGDLAAVGIIALLLFVYSIVLLVFFCIPGTKGPNRFGEDPYGADVGEVFA